MSAEHAKYHDVPAQNFEDGLLEVDIPELGPATRRKVRDIWSIDGDQPSIIMVTTDRLSAYDRITCTVPNKGKVLNLLSGWWFKRTSDIIPNHVRDVPHPNVVIAEPAKAKLSVEMVIRAYMSRASTSTSIFHNYVNLRRREIYGIRFPDGILPNEEFPMGAIVTPTTKAKEGHHDEEITDEQALELVDSELGDGVWSAAKNAALALFQRGREISLENGLILVDTKYEFGLDRNGNLMLIDEIHTPDSSRYWLAESYQDRLSRGEDPQNFDKELVRKWLAFHGFTGEGPVPVIDRSVIDEVSEAYTVPYRMLTGRELPLIPSTNQSIKQAVLSALPR